VLFWVEVIIFSSVRFLSKKITKLKFKKKKTETEPVQTDRFRFGFLGQKPVQTGLARFFLVWLGFFPVWLGSVQFGFFGFRLIKPKPNQTGQFFQNFNRFNQFFFTVQFFRLFFFRFSWFFGFFTHLYFGVSFCVKSKGIILKNNKDKRF
jgi:hypothetical protein